MNLFIKTTPKAEQDLDDLYQYLARENEDIALRFFDSFRETIAQLSKMPNMGKYYQINNPRLKGLRRWSVKGFKLYNQKGILPSVIFGRNPLEAIVDILSA